MIVLDDIVTTGATLTEARRALQAAGWPVLGRGGDRLDPAPADPKWARIDHRLNWAELAELG